MHCFCRTLLGSVFAISILFFANGCGTSEQADTTLPVGDSTPTTPEGPPVDHSNHSDRLATHSNTEPPRVPSNPREIGASGMVPEPITPDDASIEEPFSTPLDMPSVRSMTPIESEPVVEPEHPLFIAPQNMSQPSARYSIDEDPNIAAMVPPTLNFDQPMMTELPPQEEGIAESPRIAMRSPEPIAMESIEVNPDTSESPWPMALDDEPSSETRWLLNQPAMSPPEFDTEEAMTAAEDPRGETAPVDEEVFAMAPIASSPDIEPETPDPGFQRVTIFYGTDRKAVTGIVSSRKPYIAWFFRTIFIAAITLVCCCVALWRRNHRASWSMAATGAIATAVLSIVSLAAWLQSDPSLASPERMYGNERGVLEMGTCEVTIPNKHELAAIERPSIFRFELTEDPTKHIVLTGVHQHGEDVFYSAMRDRVKQSKKKEAFVFVHGYNVTFDAAARRTAQLAHDLKFDGVPIFYSWPSQGGLLRYAVDETNAIWTAPQLKQFLLQIAERSDARSIHLIAHSMGNRALTSALQSLANDSLAESPLFREVILTAPDIDADIFRRDIAPSIVKMAERVTLYASSNDKALALSKQVHGYPRAGDSGDKLIVVPGIETIDVSGIDTSLVAHSYYGSNQTVLADLLDVIHDRKPPGQRPFLRPMERDEKLYWVFLSGQNSPLNAAHPMPTTTIR